MDLETQVKELGIKDIFYFAGFVNDIQTAIQSLDIFVMPSLTEGFPVALAEAMAAGKPVVVTNVGGMKEMVTNHKNGILVPPKDSNTLADEIINILRDKSEMNNLANAAKLRSEDFSIEKNVEKLQNLYVELVN